MKDPIKAKIIELCPDIMELEFGCSLYQPKHKKTLVYVGKDNGQFAVKFEGDDRLIIADSISDCEILGRPITLADVLRAIANRTDERCITVSCFGQFHEEFHEEDEWDTQPLHHHWNLLKDYDDQEQATKDFIGSLLGV